jgi:hypothetical protein
MFECPSFYPFQQFPKEAKIPLLSCRPPPFHAEAVNGVPSYSADNTSGDLWGNNGIIILCFCKFSIVFYRIGHIQAGIGSALVGIASQGEEVVVVGQIVGVEAEEGARKPGHIGLSHSA